MLPEPAEDLSDIVPCGGADDLLVALAHVGLEAAQIPFDLGVRGQRAELTLEHLPHGDNALVGTVFLGETGRRDRLAFIDVHYVHGAVADVCQHVRAPELAQPVGDCRKPLIEHEHVHDIDVIVAVLVGEVDMGVLGQVCLELLPLLVSPGQGQPKVGIPEGFQVWPEGQTADGRIGNSSAAPQAMTIFAVVRPRCRSSLPMAASVRM